MGKHKRKFTDEQIAEMEEMALQGCQNGTIANKMDIPATTIDSRPDIRKLLTKKRAERKLRLYTAQTEKAIIGKDAGLLMFLGKNELGQVDKQHFVDETDQKKELTESQSAAADEYAAYWARKLIKPHEPQKDTG